MILLGALIYRIRGMDGQPLFHPFWQVLFSAPFAWIVYDTYKDAHLEPAFFIGLVLSVWAATVIFTLSGTGRGLGIKLPLRGEPEYLEAFTKWLIPSLTTPAYKTVFNCVRCLFIAMPCALAMLNPYIAFYGVLAGLAFTAPAYMMKDDVDAQNEAGEFLIGAVLWSAVC